MSKPKRTVIDLFAGCGGLSLGLENAGFETIGFTEIARDAAATFIHNRPHLKSKSGLGELAQGHLSPDYENPRYTENTWSLTRKNGKRGGRKDCSRLDALLAEAEVDRGQVDLVVGGPPCQGYSRLGHRRTHAHNREENPGNFLYESMAEVIDYVKPRMFIFENVQGLVNAKWTQDSDCPGEVFEDVLRQFEKIGSHNEKSDYIIRWRLIRAHEYGVPQNRPRIIAIGIRRDIQEQVENVKFDDCIDGIAARKKRNRSKRANRVSLLRDQTLNCEFGLHPQPGKKPFPSPREAIGDLIDPNYQNLVTEFKKNKTDRSVLRTDKYPSLDRTSLSAFQKQMRSRKRSVTGHEYSNHSEEVKSRFVKIQKAGRAEGKNKNKKFSQRVLGKAGSNGNEWTGGKPNITVTSMPDDYVHFEQPRSLTVREWARLQTFPDSYEFQGKRTTGGIRRAGNPLDGIHEREVPQYTQIGNAVPPLLAERLGKHIDDLLNAYEQAKR